MNAEWFAGRLRELREAAGLTQQQLADRSGTGWRTIAHLEGGDRQPSWGTVLALCQALGVTCEAFTHEPVADLAPRPGRPPKAAPPAAEKRQRPPGRRRRSKGKS